MASLIPLPPAHIKLANACTHMLSAMHRGYKAAAHRGGFFGLEFWKMMRGGLIIGLFRKTPLTSKTLCD